jgi:hypothetical protein
MQAVQRDVLYRNRVPAIQGDHRIVADLAACRPHNLEAAEQAIVERDHVVAVEIAHDVMGLAYGAPLLPLKRTMDQPVTSVPATPAISMNSLISAPASS